MTKKILKLIISVVLVTFVLLISAFIINITFFEPNACNIIEYNGNKYTREDFVFSAVNYQFDNKAVMKEHYAEVKQAKCKFYDEEVDVEIRVNDENDRFILIKPKIGWKCSVFCRDDIDYKVLPLQTEHIVKMELQKQNGKAVATIDKEYYPNIISAMNKNNVSYLPDNEFDNDFCLVAYYDNIDFPAELCEISTNDYNTYGLKKYSSIESERYIELPEFKYYMNAL